MPTTQAQSVAIESSQINSSGILQIPGGGTGVNGNPTFYAYQTVSQSVPVDNLVTLALNVIQFDTNGCFNNTSSTQTLNGISVPAYSFAPNVAGYYQVSGNVIFGVGGTYANYPCSACEVLKNGTVALVGTSGGTDGANAVSNVNGIIYLNGTSDYISYIVVPYNSGVGGPFNTTSSLGPALNYFCATLIRGT